MDLNNIVFSIIFEDFEKVSKFCLEYFEKEKIQISTSELSISYLSMLEQQGGGAHLPKYLFFRSDPKNVTFFISNYLDGLVNFTNFIGKGLKVRTINISILSEVDYPKYSYQNTETGLEARVVQLVKDTKWEFYQSGRPLSYEKVENYLKRNKKERLNSEIIQSYLKEEGIDLKNVLSQFTNGIIVERLSWK